MLNMELFITLGFYYKIAHILDPDSAPMIEHGVLSKFELGLVLVADITDKDVNVYNLRCNSVPTHLRLEVKALCGT